MITNEELFKKMMHFSRELRMEGVRGAVSGPEGKEGREHPMRHDRMNHRRDDAERGERPHDRDHHDKDHHGRGRHERGGKHGRGMTREHLLVIIADHPEGVWQKDIAGEAGINASSTSEVVGKLEEDGYLVRESDEADKRAVLLKLTETGAARAAEIRAERKANLDRFFSKLTDEEKQTLSDLLDKLTD